MSSAREFCSLLARDPARPLVELGVVFPPAVPACVPADTTWLWWWAPVIGPAPVFAVAYLHHLLAVGNTEVDLTRLPEAIGLGPSLPWAEDHPVPKAVTVAASHRLLFLADDGRLVLLSPVYRPGPDGAREALRLIHQAKEQP